MLKIFRGGVLSFLDQKNGAIVSKMTIALHIKIGIKDKNKKGNISNSKSFDKRIIQKIIADKPVALSIVFRSFIKV